MTENVFAEKIKRLRLERGMTLEQVADIVGVGKSTVRKWETGMIANMRRDKIADLAKALGTTPAYLMGWEEEAEEPRKLTEAEEYAEKLFRDPTLRMLFSAADGARKEDLELAAQMLRRMKHDAGYDD